MSDREITAELTVVPDPGVAPDEPLGPHVELTMGAKTDLGRVRENNEDKFDWAEPDDAATLDTRGRLYAVADGMGGHAAGQISSELALKTLFRSYYAGMTGRADQALLEGIHAANALVTETAARIPGRSGMGTTLSCVVVIGDRAIIGQVGDSRIYRLRGGKIAQITDDHSWVGEQVRSGVLTLDQALASPYRNVVTSCIGIGADLRVDHDSFRLEPGDRLLLCSDGLSNVVSDDEMAEELASRSPSMAAWRLIDLANDRGGPDNITCMILKVEGYPKIEGGERAPSGEPSTGGDAPVPADRREPTVEKRGSLWGFLKAKTYSIC